MLNECFIYVISPRTQSRLPLPLTTMHCNNCVSCCDAVLCVKKSFIIKLLTILNKPQQFKCVVTKLSNVNMQLFSGKRSSKVSKCLIKNSK